MASTCINQNPDESRTPRLATHGLHQMHQMQKTHILPGPGLGACCVTVTTGKMLQKQLVKTWGKPWENHGKMSLPRLAPDRNCRHKPIVKKKSPNRNCYVVENSSKWVIWLLILLFYPHYASKFELIPCLVETRLPARMGGRVHENYC